MAHSQLRILVAIIVLSISVTTFAPQRISASPNSIQAIYSGLDWPVAFTFLPDGRILFNEKNTGNIRVIASNGNLLSQPFATLGPLPPGVVGTEQGLLGIALDPQFNVNNYVYVYWTYYNSAELQTQHHQQIHRNREQYRRGPNGYFRLHGPEPESAP